MRRQQGFTLIEVVVAFAIFALCVGAIYESFSGAMRRSAQAQARELAWLQAQSVLSEQRLRPGPWEAQRTGDSAAGLAWKVQTAPFDAGSDGQSPWRAYQVTVRVQGRNPSAGEVVLNSIELARSLP